MIIRAILGIIGKKNKALKSVINRNIFGLLLLTSAAWLIILMTVHGVELIRYLEQ